MRPPSIFMSQDRGEEDGEIRNVVFRQVANSWLSIKARLSNVTDSVVEPRRAISSLLIVPRRQEPEESRLGAKRDVATQRFFFSRLVQLLASMFECSGDFMADRFKSSVWPILAKQFAHLMESNQHSKPGVIIRDTMDQQHDIVSVNDYQNREWSDSERHLLLSMLNCLERVYGSEESRGTTLARIHQTVGIVLLPFVGDPDDEISSCAMAAIKNIVHQDCDVLLRPLLETSGRGIPPCPVEIPGAPNAIVPSTGSSLSTTAKSKLARGCEDILSFIENLDEQEIL